MYKNVHVGSCNLKWSFVSYYRRLNASTTQNCCGILNCVHNEWLFYFVYICLTNFVEIQIKSQNCKWIVLPHLYPKLVIQIKKEHNTLHLLHNMHSVQYWV